MITDYIINIREADDYLIEEVIVEKKKSLFSRGSRKNKEQIATEIYKLLQKDKEFQKRLIDEIKLRKTFATGNQSSSRQKMGRTSIPQEFNIEQEKDKYVRTFGKMIGNYKNKVTKEQYYKMIDIYEDGLDLLQKATDSNQTAQIINDVNSKLERIYTIRYPAERKNNNIGKYTDTV